MGKHSNYLGGQKHEKNRTKFFLATMFLSTELSVDILSLLHKIRHKQSLLINFQIWDNF